MNPYYENVSKLKELRELFAPTEADLKKVLEIVKGDTELTLYFYDVLGPGWVELLDKAGEFEELRKKETGMIGKYKAHYLKQCAENKNKAEAVLGIIEKLEVQDINIQGTLIRAIVKMPEETAINGVGVVTKYLDEQENKWWYAIGESAAELMVNLLANYPDGAFEVAEALLDVWVSEEKTFGKDTVGKFSKDEYSRLMLEHYRKVWEANPERAIRVLIKIFDRCLEALDDKKDASRSFGYGLELGDLDKIDMNHPEIKTILVKGICEAGRVLVVKEPEKVSELLDLLEGTNRIIFLRIAMYLLRFVEPSTEDTRISKFVGEREYFKKYNSCWNEHRRLLNDKFEEVSAKAKKEFLDWVDEDKISKDYRKEVMERCKANNEAEPDFEKWENIAKAEELYLVRERFEDEYAGYKKAAGVKNDSELAPRKSVGGARFVDPKEGTPLSAEDMASKTCDEVLDYLLEPKNYEGKERASGWGTAEDALGATFNYDVKKRYKDYLGSDVEKLKNLPSSFLARFFWGEEDAVREGSFSTKEWGLLIGFASLVVEEKHEDQEYSDCFSEILSVLREGFGGGKGELELDESTAREFWGILKKLIYFPIESIENRNEERDPIQLRLRHVAGKALGLTILLGLTCKKGYSEYWEEELKDEMRECWEYTLKKIREPGINCFFGIDFSRIYWLDTEWVEGNLGLIFKDELWDEVWGTYTSWGRPSPDGFKLLVEKGKYEQAVDMFRTESKFKFGKEPDKGLTEHLMIGYFNGWIDYDHKVLQNFFEKAPENLREKAARFLATGFKDVNEKGGDEKREVAARMKQYWKSRLAVKDKEEAIGFMRWMKDSVLDGKETLEFVEETLKISGGKLSKYGDSKRFVDGICNLGRGGNELLALRCLKLAASDENMHMTWASIQDPLVDFLGTMVDMQKDVRSVAMEVADMYGRYNPGKFHGVWTELNKKNRGES